MLWLQLDGDGPLHRQLYRALRAAILSGRLTAGQRLPGTRQLARELGISRNTVLQACEQLLAEGYATGRARSGTFAAAALPARSAVPRGESAAAAPEAREPALSELGRRLSLVAPPGRAS